MNASHTPDRKGITLDASLAWTMLGTIVACAFWFGVELSAIKSTIAETKEQRDAFSAQYRADKEAQAADRTAYRRETDVRLRTLEQDRVGDRRDLANALNLLTRIDQRLERIEQRTTP